MCLERERADERCVVIERERTDVLRERCVENERDIRENEKERESNKGERTSVNHCVMSSGSAFP